MNFSYDKILTLAPDPGTAQRAKALAYPLRWLSLEGNGRAIWGTLGDPTNPFRTQVDLVEPAFRCSCPVRRKPCKHCIGLLLLFSKSNDAFQVVEEPPEWVSAWLKKRPQHSTTSPVRSAEADEVLAQKRRQNREKRISQMTAGLAELESWLLDLFRQGLAILEGHATDYWNQLGARMVDARLGTLARRIRQLPLLMGSDNWHEKVLAELGDIYLLLRAFQRIEQLPGPLQDDLLGIAGIHFKKDDLLALSGLQDDWLVAGQTEEEEENLLARYTWLAGEKSGRTGLLLDFSWGGQGYETSWQPGSVLRGEVVFYPSAFPQRILIKDFKIATSNFTLRSGFPTLKTFAENYADALAANPWIARFPAFLENVVPVFDKSRFVLIDSHRKMLPLSAGEGNGWELLALSGGRPVQVFGIWNSQEFTALSLIANGQFRLLYPAKKSETVPFSQGERKPF